MTGGAPGPEVVPDPLGDGTAGEAARPGVLVWRFPSLRRSLSTAPLGGGLGLARWALNLQVPGDYARTDPAAHLASVASALGLEPGGLGMMTAVDVRDWQWACEDGVEVAVTVGVTSPTWAAAPDDGSDARGAAVHAPGTINVVASLPAALDDAALVNAATTVAEAKAQALAEAGVAGTGTASDAVGVLCPAVDGDVGGERATGFGGPRSYWGSRLARAVHRAVLAGLAGAPR
ncbi:MAG TPA: adenosylcobinamide amidohydrolase [Acidimicrobiales bacterium]|nr:adenosylcobinamide amidohydrolase [Acidimicrobiales bacterium]